MASGTMYWNDLLGKPVQLSGQGRKAGVVTDFYYDPDTQSIAGLRIKTPLYGPRVLLTSAIAALDHDGVTIANENMLIDETNAGHLSQLPLGSRFASSRVVSEQGHDIGTVSTILLNIYPPAALHISAFEVRQQRHRRISAHAITRIHEDTLIIMEQEAF